jgi:hypothetical protein
LLISGRRGKLMEKKAKDPGFDANYKRHMSEAKARSIAKRKELLEIADVGFPDIA